jgi:hypothetical protein
VVAAPKEKIEVMIFWKTGEPTAIEVAWQLGVSTSAISKGP